MLLDTMSLKLLNQWGSTLWVASLSMLKAAELTGRILDECAERQRSELGVALSRGATAMRWVLASTAPAATARTRRDLRVALVTGGTGEPGAAICVHLAAAGYQVIATCPRGAVVAARQWRWAQRLEGLEIAVVECEVGHYEDCARLAAWVIRRFGHVDCLVNCIDVRRNDTLGAAAHQESWNVVLEANLDGLFNVTRNVMPGMVERHSGRIINVAAWNTVTARRPEPHRATATAGIVGFTKSLARELADQGIPVNSVSRAGGGASVRSALPEQLRSAIHAKARARRKGDLDEVAIAVAFLADDASRDLTGIDIALNDERLRVPAPRARPRRPRNTPTSRL